MANDAVKIYEVTKQVAAVEWRQGVDLPNANKVEFPERRFNLGEFPPHALVVVNGRYEVLFEGYGLLYEPHGGGNPTKVVESMTNYKLVENHGK